MTKTTLAVLVFVSFTAFAQRPPKEAVVACEGKAAGAACQFTHEQRDLTGTCFSPSEDKPLACRPANAPPPKQDGR